MMNTDNPCLTCPDTCCGTPGKFSLRISKEEFEKHFKDRADDLIIKEDGNVVMIFSKEGKACPNLGKKGCEIYLDRPIDCRLYPYQLLQLYETRTKAKLQLYIKPNCIENKTFFTPEEDATALVEEFGRNVYGDKKIIVQIFEDKFFAKLKNKIEVLFFKIFRRL